jgi:hypothetical protein
MRMTRMACMVRMVRMVRMVLRMVRMVRIAAMVRMVRIMRMVRCESITTSAQAYKRKCPQAHMPTSSRARLCGYADVRTGMMAMYTWREYMRIAALGCAGLRVRCVRAYAHAHAHVPGLLGCATTRGGLVNTSLAAARVRALWLRRRA